jgi:hypothetical protein
VTTATVKHTKTEIARIYRDAEAAGKAAGDAVSVTPMTVVMRSNMFDDTSPVVKAYHVPDGVCGFAWVNVGGNTAMGRYMKSKGHRAGYPKGINYWVSAYGQSMTRKEAFAHAFAKVLRDNGIAAYADSRMD